MKSTTELTLDWRRIKWDFTGYSWLAFSQCEDGGVKYVVDLDRFGKATLTVTHPSFFGKDSFSKRFDLPSVEDAKLLAQHLERNIA